MTKLAQATKTLSRSGLIIVNHTCVSFAVDYIIMLHKHAILRIPPYNFQWLTAALNHESRRARQAGLLDKHDITDSSTMLHASVLADSL